MFLGHLVYLKAKAGGEKSMPRSGSHWKTLKVPSRKTRVIGRKLDCRASCYPTSYPPFNEEALG